MMRWIGGTTALIGLTVGGFALSARNPSPAPSPDPAPAERAFAADAVAPNTDAPTAEPAPAAESAAANSLVIKRVLPIKGPIRYGEWHWDEAGVPDGPLIMTVDLDARVLSVFRGGYEIGATAVMLGTQEHPTPLGSFPILTKERHNVSEKYNNAPMPWTLRLTWDGIAIHGGAEVENGYASHGCIGTPDPFAAKLFAAASKGDRVIITRGKRIGTGDALI
ncbi:L,D-transpeptidase family protein [Pseudopontixanthobacter vadosimaris]|uniref:L,D-transpeptidase family protein n=1 Tax=Pseudopontixanthobacter vadosimaris TaxID=2726450 RepID=UPI001F0FBD7D|nr:L,D-transpeptidase family protein [Pseudopontixanthobacter vadosimaris]